MKKLKLEVGKAYRSRKGEEVRIVGKDNQCSNPYQGSNGERYAEGGKWRYDSKEDSEDLVEEVAELPKTRYTFAIPYGASHVTVEQVSNRIVVEMVPEAPKPGDVLVNDRGSVYIFKSVRDDGGHNHFAWLGDSRSLRIAEWCFSGRPATPEEAQPLWDALKKAGKRWNGETLEVEEIPEIDLIREWVERHFLEGHYTQDNISEVIEAYSNYKEAKNNKKDV